MRSQKITDVISAESLNRFIWEGINKVEGSDSVDLYLPWYFGGEGAAAEPLKITFRRVRSEHVNAGPIKQKYSPHSVDDTQYDTYEISDNGRAIAELERRVGDLTPYRDVIERLIYNVGMYTLRADRIVSKTYSLYAEWRHIYVLDGMLKLVSMISWLDMLPQFTTNQFSRDSIDPTPCNVFGKKTKPIQNRDDVIGISRALSGLYSTRALDEQITINCGISLDGEGIALSFKLGEGKANVIEAADGFKDWMGRIIYELDEYNAYIERICDSLGVSWDAAASTLVLSYRRNDMSIAAAVCRVHQAVLLVGCLDYYLFV